MTKKIKSLSIWVYFPYNIHDRLEPLLETKANSMGGKLEGGGTDITTGCKDVSFGFKDPDQARQFAKDVQEWKHVTRVEEFEGE